MNSKYQTLNFLLLFFATIIAISCTSYLENPLKDKENGEDINLLVIDASVFPVRLQIFLIDSISESAVVKPAIISFSGNNGTDIITFSGKKQSEFRTSNGFLELAVDPNIAVSKTAPLSFTIHVKAEGYPETAKEFIFDTHGVKEIKLHL